ncbi:hypothetical protein GALMADRAFT_239202 [Galerina marginata CBS 339.88]|uniref:PEBP-like protein n=1 Tax=Galerina marginata (strain CBS 339.88) TaxID=685588 RepID=A0A067TQW1_GALM3|nr:hypothetical protein GALMADRAFT_239202 [Galerina marginata CBS 339.88]
MLSLSVVASLVLVPFVAAQATSIDIKAIEAHFTQSAIVPDLLASFNPSALLSLNFAGVGDVSPGQLLTVQQVGPTPAVTVTPANTSVSLTGTYTLVMVDADVVGKNLPDGQTRHWLVNGVTISGSKVTNSSATAITSYAGPFPAAGSGPHRYVVILYEQPSTFKAPAAFSQPNTGVSAFDFNGYVKDSGLGPLVAANYIDVEQGTSTVSVSPTSAVVTSTLLPPSSGSSSSPSKPSNTNTNTNGAGNIATHFLTMVAAVAGFMLTVEVL